MIKHLKEWDKLYVKHMKGGYIEMNVIFTTAMKPLTDLLESNLNFHYLEQLEKTKDIPSFRHEALETKFIEHFTTICDIFKAYGDLKDTYNIKH